VFHAQLTWPLSCKYGLLAARLARVPAVVATAHSRYQIAPVLARQPRVIARCVDRYLAVSQGVARQLREDFRIPARKVSLVRNGIVPPGVPPPQARAALRAQLTAGADRPIVLTVARLDLRKGLQYLLDAVRQVPQAMLVLAGDGEDRSTLEAQARDLQVADRVVFLGHRTDVPALLAAADVFVLPSLTEGLPISLLEAMAAGTPVVGTAIEGIDELIVAGETGVLVPPADANGLAAGILAVLRDPAGAHVRATAARAFVDREFTVERARTQVLEVYRELLVAKGRMDP
jgi:glycosyltransferase involved in cell wall biosynthesis